MKCEEELRKSLSCPLEKDRKLAPLSTLGVGGVCEFFVEPVSLRDVSALFQMQGDENFPLYILGGGSNIVFADGKLEGVVLSTRRLGDFKWEAEGVMTAECGCPLSLVVSSTVREGWAGAEFATGIPGTVGGAVAGNAGVGDDSVGNLLKEVMTVERDGSARTWRRDEFNYSYRYFSLFSPDRLIAGCKMKFSRTSRAETEKKTETFRRARANQPLGAKSAGCIFKNPAGHSAGRLLDIAGCKGLCVGDAVVSDVHANFIINRGRAAAVDIFKLMESCRDIVLRETGILLEPEIKLVGFGLGP